jgi:hypothetical protein
MRFSLLFLGLTISYFANAQTVSSSKIRFDGFYQTISDIDKQDNDTTYDYLRFYSDGKVISVTSEGTALDLKDWFDLKMNNPSIGSYDYKIKGGKIYFSTTSKEGSVIYHGKIKRDYYLLLKFRSLITGRRGREKYYFIKVDDLK